MDEIEEAYLESLRHANYWKGYLDGVNAAAAKLGAEALITESADLNKAHHILCAHWRETFDALRS